MTSDDTIRTSFVCVGHGWQPKLRNTPTNSGVNQAGIQSEQKFRLT
jgi:hypothetical protein